MGKVCCFIGHRKIEESEELVERIKQTVISLINEGVDTFLFGSRSDFDDICHKIVTDLKQSDYPNIIRKCYTCRHETCTLESEREYWEEIYSHFEKRPVTLLGVEQEVEHKTKYTSGKASYIERNQAMIDDSDFCVFYYDENYLPPRRKYSKRSLIDYQPKSGTDVAYKYAEQKKKRIINVFNTKK